jgi:predicted metal-dependent peptidase
MDDKTKIATVRFLAAHKRPYFATALFAMHLVPRPNTIVDLGGGMFMPLTMAVDKYGRVYIDPNLIHIGQGVPQDKWSVEEAASVLVHEVGHWLRKHHERADVVLRGASLEEQEQTRHLVNIAEDCELNDDLKNEGMPLPGDPPMPHKYGYPEGLLWEEYYQMLLKNPPPPSGGGGRGKGAPGTASKGKSGGGTMPDKCDCGSGAHGVPREYELPAPGGATKEQGIGEAEGDLLRQQVAREIQAAAARGNVPAGWKRWAEALLEPPVAPWERELSALVKNAVTMARGMCDFSYSKVSRRGMFQGVIMPALVRPNPDAAVVVDTSGSMSEALLARALIEIKGILRAVGQRRVPVLCCDAAVHGGVQRVSNAFDVELAGGGGTDMGIGIEAAQKLRASVIIVLTDGFTPWPADPPRGCQLVIGILNPDSGVEDHYPAPPYAKRVLKIRDPKEKAA